MSWNDLTDEEHAPVYGDTSATNPDADKDGDEMLVFDRELFSRLHLKRKGKALAVPADLLNYADPEYIPKNAYTDAMMAFLKKMMVIDRNAL